MGTLLCCVGSWSFGVRISLCLFFFIPDSVRKALTSFKIFSQPAGSVGKPNHPVHWVLFTGTTVWVLCFVCVSFWSFGVVIALCLFFKIPDSIMKVLEYFENFSQLYELVGKPNQPIHYVQFFEIDVLVLFFVCVDYHSFRVRIALSLFFFGFLTL